MISNLTTGPILWVPLTLAIYFAMSEAYKSAGKPPLLNPTLFTIASISLILLASNVPHATYFEAVSVLHYLLGTAVVALAIPLYRNLRHLKGKIALSAAAIFAGSLTSLTLGILIASAFGATASTLLSLAPKSATAAVSMEIARGIGGVPAITATLTIMTGITGAILGPYILTLFGIQLPMARGLALGTASHGIATARAFSENEITGCWSTVAMGLNAILTALLVACMMMFFTPL